MTEAVQSKNMSSVPKKKSKLEKMLTNRSLWRGVLALIGAVLSDKLAKA